MSKYISVGMDYGMTVSGFEGYRNIHEIAQEMDRLGISQSVVEYNGLSNSLACNKKLLEDIASVPGGKERMIPGFNLNPGALFQRNAMEQIIEMLENNRPNCVILKPDGHGYQLMMAEMVLEKISYLNPVCLINETQLREPGAVDDLVYLAKKFPNMRFVIRRFIWGGWSRVYNAARQAENICIDISRLHTTHAIELACEHLGEHKVLWGHSRKSGMGAAMAAVTYAEVSEETKDKIRWGNFVDLFQDPQDRKLLLERCKELPNKVANSFWTPFVEGKGFDACPVYDVHTHLGYTAVNGYVKDLTFEDEIATFEKNMALFNVKKIVSTVTGIHDPVECHLLKEAAVKGKEDRFKGYIRYNPNYTDIFTEEFMDERFATGYYVGLKSLPHYMKVDLRDERYAPMFEYAQKHSLPILIHNDMSRGSPKVCAEMAAKYPNCKMLLGHSGGADAGREQCHELAKDPRYDNVYFEFCGTFLANSWTWKESLEHIDYRRVLFGTDAPIHSMIWELGRLLCEDIPDEQLIAILGGNAKRIFGFA